MIDLWYTDISEISNGTFSFLLKSLPDNMRNEILRFRLFTDRCLKLYGKLIVKKYFLDHNIPFSWKDWKLTTNGKPFIKDKLNFNISHSGSVVSVAFSEKRVGVDVEKMSDIDTLSIAELLHPDEARFIEEAENQQDAFFKVWTRKEAYLKALGVGILEGVNQQNCLKPSIINTHEWFLHSVNFRPEYQMALCTQIPNENISKHELKPTEF